MNARKNLSPKQKKIKKGGKEQRPTGDIAARVFNEGGVTHERKSPTSPARNSSTLGFHPEKRRILIATPYGARVLSLSSSTNSIRTRAVIVIRRNLAISQWRVI
ncbi:hypothetical protein ACLOJK_021152 [Asimina triloba]